MLQYRHPGVYTREIPSGTRAIANAPTSVALFVGPTKSGIDHRHIRVQSFADFERAFGGLSDKSSLSYSVLHFFSNGGGEAFVRRVPAKDALAAESGFKRDGVATESLRVTALSSGAASSDLFVEIDPFGLRTKPFSADADKKRFNLTIVDRLTGQLERWPNLSTSANDARYAEKIVNDEGTGSKLVAVEVSAQNPDGPQASGSIYKVGKLPAPGDAAIATPIKVKVSVTALTKLGTATDAEASFSALMVTVIDEDEVPPKSMLAFTARLVARINAAIRADDTAREAMQGVTIEGAHFVEGDNTFIRLLTTRPEPAAATTRRLPDATVTLAAPGGGATSLLTTYSLNSQVERPSRYQLGESYGAGSQVLSPTAGTDGDATANGQPDDPDFKKAVMALDDYDPFFNILCLPDLARPSASNSATAQHSNAMEAFAEAARVCKEKHAFLLVDPLPEYASVGAAESWKTTEFFQSSHSAVFFPNIRVNDPLFPGTIRSHPPSGAIAGVMARTDTQYGVWQAPAGTEASLAGVYGPSVVLSDADQGVLNPLAVNCIRRFPIYGTVSFGSRTVDGADVVGSEWKYIPVRRTASHILRSLSDSLRWAVHKPNGEALWSQLRMDVTSFMHRLFRQGAFKGVSAREAYFVRCDASTTPPDEQALGIVHIVVGFAPLRSAEFVVVNLRQIVQASA